MKDQALPKSAEQGTPAHASRSWVDASHLFALWTFAVAQPIFDLIGRQPDFLVAQRLSGAPIVLLVLAGTLGIPALLALPLLIPGAATNRAARLWSDGLRTLLAAAFILQLLHWLPATVALVLSVAGGTGTALCLNRYRVLSNAVAVAAVAALVAPAVFLLRPGVRGLLPTVSASHFEPDSTIARAPYFESDLPIVLIVFDELPTSSLQRPDGSIDDRRFPSFAALAESADWYVGAVTAGLQTAKSIPALLTGKLPQGDTTAYYNDHTSNLFSWLGSRGGYRVVARETMSQLCPAAVCGETRAGGWTSLRSTAEDLSVVYGHLLLPAELRSRLPSVSHSWTRFRGTSSNQQDEERKAHAGALFQDVPRLLDDFLRRLEQPGQTPTFYYLHLNLPHRPWKYLPSGREYTLPGTPISPPGFEAARLAKNDQLATHGLQRHLLQVGYADRVLGQVLDRLKEAAIYDQAMIVVAADHGHSFRPGELRRSPTEANVEDVLEVPLLVKRPGQTEGAVFDHVVQTIDIVPTIAATLGTELPWRADGRHLSDRSPRNISVCCFRDDPDVRAFRTDPERRQQTLDRLHRLFATGTTDSPFSGVFSAGPRPDLLGRATVGMTDEDSTDPSTAKAILAGPSAFENIRPETGFIPSLVSGRIEPPVANGTPLAVSVDGIVRATTETFFHRGASRFSALVDERWLQAASHQIGVFAIEENVPSEDQHQTTLRTLLGGEPAPRLLTEADRVRGVDLGGGMVLKQVHHLFRCEMEVAAGGFLGRILSRPGLPADSVDEFFVFSGADLVYRGEDDRSRRRVRPYGGQREQMTFRISLPATLVNENSLTLLARSGDQVQVLYPPRPRGRFELTHDAQGRDLLLRRPQGIAGAEPERVSIESVGNEIIGAVEGWSPEEMQIRGWTADLGDLGVHQEVVVFLHGRELWVGQTGRRNRQVAAQAGHSYSGFVLPDSRYSASGSTPRLRTRDLAAIERHGLVVYAVSRRNVAARLPFAYQPLERTADDGELLPLGDGRRLSVQAPGDGFRSAFQVVATPGQGTLIEGWTAVRERDDRPREIVIYQSGEFLASIGAEPDQQSRVDQDHDRRPLPVSFRGLVPGAPDPATFAERHRVFALVSRGSAVELHVAP
ncbi:MAG: sulfatase-like hydrolase/transferase [Acidobacteria bacterium]|nr:sulfatase-like hydrolase/transferase [Acidobacteriota bacterium]